MSDYSGGKGLVLLAFIGLVIVGLILFGIGDLLHILWNRI